jgi:hypothetical protein
MDFVRLGVAYNDDYLPDMLIEGYNSLVWTERFQAPGEFELKSFDIDGLTKILPEDTLVSHLETQHVMIVETHSIEMVGEGADAQPELTVKGRTADVITESRWVESTYQKKRKMRHKYSPRGAAAVLLYQAVDNASGYDVTRGDTDPDTEDVLNNYPWNTLDVIPNVAVTDSGTLQQDSRNWQLEQGILAPQLNKILVDADLGLRVLRPAPNNNGTVVTVKSALADRGDIVRTDKTDITQLRFDIYNGIDRSDTVQLSMLQGHLDKPQYLKSIQTYKTVVQVKSAVTGGWLDQYRPGAGESGFTGFKRRTLEFEAGSPELPPEPQEPRKPKSSATDAQKKAYREDYDKWVDKWAKWDNKRDRIWADFREEETKAVQRALKQARRVVMFSGDISDLSPYKYKVHYDLGDTVSLFGDYGYKQKMVVAEYVRTEDANGDRGIPGLVLP